MRLIFQIIRVCLLISKQTLGGFAEAVESLFLKDQGVYVRRLNDLQAICFLTAFSLLIIVSRLVLCIHFVTSMNSIISVSPLVDRSHLPRTTWRKKWRTLIFWKKLLTRRCCEACNTSGKRCVWVAFLFKHLKHLHVFLCVRGKSQETKLLEYFAQCVANLSC